MIRSELHDLNGHPALAVLAWCLGTPHLCASTASVGGGIGPRAWVINAQVPHDYARLDVAEHVAEIAAALALRGPGVGMLTAAQVSGAAVAEDGDVRVEATVGLTRPIWAAAAPNEKPVAAAGTINVVAFVPVRHSEAALANLLCTMTEAKVQALFEGGVPATGTASDAMTVLCPVDGPVEPFGGARSRWGASVARGVRDAVRSGMARP